MHSIGCFDGGVFRDGVEECVSLEAWARDNDMLPPEVDVSDDAYIEWMDEVEQEFHAVAL